jgi:outer membrane protein assembly factor BamE
MYGDFKPSNLPVLKPSDDKIVDLPKREVDRTLWEMTTDLFGFDSSDVESSAPKEPKPNANLPF